MGKNKTKSVIIPAFIISGIVSFILFVVDGICAYTIGSMPVCISSYGGDCTEYLGIGWTILTVYPSTTMDDPVQKITTVSFSFSIFVCWGLIWIAVVLLMMLFKKFRSKSVGA